MYGAAGLPRICCGLEVGFGCVKLWFSIAMTNTVRILLSSSAIADRAGTRTATANVAAPRSVAFAAKRVRRATGACGRFGRRWFFMLGSQPRRFVGKGSLLQYLCE